MRTQVIIIGGGPSGLLLSQLLMKAGIETVVLEKHQRSHVLNRIRAGVIEPGSISVLSEAGIGDRIDIGGKSHSGTVVSFDNQIIRVDLKAATNKNVTVFGQTEITRELYLEQDRLNAKILHNVRKVLPKDFHLYPQDWTWEGFLDELADENTGLWVRDEFSGWLANNSKRYMAGTTEKLRRLYDNGSVTIRTRGLGSTTVDNIAISVLLGSTPGAIAKYMNVIEELENGLLSRILLVSGDDIKFSGLWRSVPSLKKAKQNLVNKLLWIRKRATAAKRVVFEPSDEAAIKKEYNDFFFRLKIIIKSSFSKASLISNLFHC